MYIKIRGGRCKMGVVFNIQKFCLHDGDGIRTTVFLKGCPLDCIWCHNPESKSRKVQLAFTARKCTACGRCLQVCCGRSITDGQLRLDRSKCTACGKCTELCLNGANELLGREMTADEVMDEVLKDKIFYGTDGGLTVSGGEPSYQPEFTLELLGLAKESGITYAIETCGSGTRDFYTKAAGLGTTFLFDIKAIDPARHKELTGADNRHIIDNLLYLFSVGADVIIRLPMIPGCNDGDEDVAGLAAFLKEQEGHYRYAELMPYHPLGVGKAEQIGSDQEYKRDPASESEIDRWVTLFAAHGINVRVSK